MRIGFNTLSENPFSPSGAQGYFINLLREIGKLDTENEYVVFVSRTNRHLYEFGYQNFRLVHGGPSNEARKWRVLAEHTSIPALLWRYRVDVFNAPATIAPITSPGKLVLTVKALTQFHHAGAVPWRVRTYRSLMLERSARRATLVVANSDSCVEDVDRFLRVPRAKIRKVHEAYDPTIFHVMDLAFVKAELSRRFRIERPYVLFVSSFYPYKNAEGLLEAFRRVCDKPACKDMLLVCVGGNDTDGYLGKIKRQAEAIGLADRVVFTGYLPHPDVALFYNGASVFVYPSHYETFGLTIPEAMACGAPVIASNVMSIPEIAGGAAVLIDPKSVDEIADAIERVVSEDDLHTRLRESGLARAQDFSYERTAGQMIGIYAEAAHM